MHSSTILIALLLATCTSLVVAHHPGEGDGHDGHGSATATAAATKPATETGSAAAKATGAAQSASNPRPSCGNHGTFWSWAVGVTVIRSRVEERLLLSKELHEDRLAL
ncbi:hypothetical protein BCR44DRAFT_45179 [Catenaria anguillulae PL171]|uniref:Uncharacterized protein n=1 Tax=Catenaria anguillulae PL171 TaxID=765915 RepID=A0A1Y2HTG0_9FUNG|nr:hypothetical protein BCR44DRAFT_45179 [Catenaria anguillulae PL171]